MDNLDQYIEITDGDTTLNLLLLDTFGVDDKDYAALLNEEVEELYIFEIETEGDEAVFYPIEDDKELDEILAVYAELLED
ncbi:DUF1292 domain-containing protein [uncultured Helcococcus sp.]|uniref:DUF1292 domain-containing protein n=1 Tax=uncultured Helcococcus sp. TaxID=1072508 RepID=UPI00260345C3|nr:DUF1292 domain-containing protein [uncultured Helcococcus sp.]